MPNLKTKVSFKGTKEQRRSLSTSFVLTARIRIHDADSAESPGDVRVHT